jgi:hypothetical protein
VGKEFISELETCYNGNLTIALLQKMRDKFGTWSGGPDHRGHPTSLDIIKIYTDKEVHVKAINAIKDFSNELERRPKINLVDYKTLLSKTVQFLPGIDLFYGQNLGLYLALCVKISRWPSASTSRYWANKDCAMFSYPRSNQDINRS